MSPRTLASALDFLTRARGAQRGCRRQKPLGRGTKAVAPLGGERLEPRLALAIDFASGLPADMTASAYLFIGDHSVSNSEIWRMNVAATPVTAPGYGLVLREQGTFARGVSYPITVDWLATNRSARPDYDYRAWIDRSANPTWTSGSPTPSSPDFFVTDPGQLLQRRWFGSEVNATLGKTADVHFPGGDLDVDSDNSGSVDGSPAEDALELVSTTGVNVPVSTASMAGLTPLVVGISDNLRHAATTGQVSFTFSSTAPTAFRLWRDAARTLPLPWGTAVTAAQLGLGFGGRLNLQLEAVTPTTSFAAITTTALVTGGIWQGTLQDTVRARGVPGVDLDVDSDNDGALVRSLLEDREEDAGVGNGSTTSTKPGLIVPVGGSRAQMIVDVPAGRTASLAITQGADKVRLWPAPTGGTAIAATGTTIVGGSAQTFWIEAFAPSESMADIAFTLTATGGGLASSDTVRATAVAVDLDVDSDNDGPVQGSAAEDAIEDIAGVDVTPGRVLLVNDQDTDNDGIQDYFDGFNAFATAGEDDLLGNASFAPLSLTLAGLPTNTPVTLDYSGSDPSFLIEDSAGRLMPAPGHLRVWTVDATFRRLASQLRAGGHYVPPGTYSLQELGITSGQTLTLYVEAIRPSGATGDLSVTVSVPSTPLSDRVRFTSTQFTVLGKALDEPFQETGFFISSTLPSPAAIGQDGLMAGAYREYRVQIRDPRTTTTSVQIAGASLPLSRSGTTLESPTFVLIAPGATAHPTLRSIEASGSFVSWAFNPGGRRRLVTSFQLTEWDTELAGIIVDVIKQMDGTWRPSNPANRGEFGNVVHQRVGERLKGRAGWAVDVYVQNGTNEIVSIGTPPPNRTDTTQIDALKLKPGYTLEGKTVLDYTQIDDLYDVKTTASGIPDPKQAERLKSVLNGWQPGGQRSIKVGMVERRWVASAGWIDNVRYKNAIGLMRMIGLAAGVAQTAETAHAMWTFKDDDTELQALLDEARKVQTGQWQPGNPQSLQRALFIKLQVNPFLRKRFGDSVALNIANEIAFQTFLGELQ